MRPGSLAPARRARQGGAVYYARFPERSATMDDAPEPSEPLPLLARLYRERRSGVLSIGPAETALRILLRDGQIVGLGPVSAPRPRPGRRGRAPTTRPACGWSASWPRSASAREPAKPAPAAAPPSRNLRERLLETLADGSLAATFEEGAEAPADVAETAGATEPLILEAVRRMRDAGTVRTALGDLDQRLVATAALAEERTLTLTEGYLLSRIDGTSSARQVLQLVPLDPEETERTLLGLVLTGRVEYRAPRLVPRPEAEPPSPIDDPAGAGRRARGGGRVNPSRRPRPRRSPPAHPLETEEPSPPPDAPARPATAELDPEILERRKEILEIFQSLPLKNHFEVLGVEPGCSDAEVKRAYASARQALPPGRPSRPAHRGPARHPRGDLHPCGRGVGGAGRREEPRLLRGPLRGRVDRPGDEQPFAGEPARARPRRPEPELYFAPEDTLYKAQLLLAQARYWDAIQVLEATVPRMEPRRHQHRGRILLARAYAKNPNWVRRAEETLHDVVREDPVNVDAHYELGLLYKAGGLAARAQAMFRRVVELRPDHREAAAELGPGEGPGGGGLLKRLFGRGKAS